MRVFILSSAANPTHSRNVQDSFSAMRCSSLSMERQITRGLEHGLCHEYDGQRVNHSL